MSNKIKQKLDERRLFSERLKSALAKANYSDSPTHLSREINIRLANNSVTVHAARKWLMAEAIPTQEKIQILAQWLGVSMQWLRFGDGEQSNQSPESERYASVDLKMMSDIKTLDEHEREIVRDLVKSLVKIKRGKIA